MGDEQGLQDLDLKMGKWFVDQVEPDEVGVFKSVGRDVHYRQLRKGGSFQCATHVYFFEQVSYFLNR